MIFPAQDSVNETNSMHFPLSCEIADAGSNADFAVEISIL
jgi:hypothetical protein